MANDPERDLIPIRDVKSSVTPHYIVEPEGSEAFGHDRPTLLEKRIADQLSRNELEDNLHRLKNENFELKKTSRNQEDQLKKLTTKMSRLVSEKKKNENTSSPSSKGYRRDIEMEDVLEELHDKVRTLEKSNVHLKEKLLVAKQQVITQTCRPNPYNFVPAKVNSNRPRSGVSPYSVSANMQNTHRSRRNTTAAPLPPYVIQLLDEARNELFNLKELVSTQKSELDVYENEIEILKEKLKIKSLECEEELNILKSQITEGQRQHVQENLDLIRLHRELKQKNSKISSMQAQFTETDEKLKAQKVTHDRLVKELEERTAHLREEQKKSLEIFGELQKSKAALLHLAELQESLKALKKENDVLKDTNDQLIKSVLNQEKERTTQSLEQAFNEKISQLEYHLTAERKAKDLLQEEINSERGKFQQLCTEHAQLENHYSEAKMKMDELESKVNILKSNEVDFDELGEALALLKLKKQQAINIRFLNDGQAEEQEDLLSKLKKSETDHTDTIKELCSVREMLMTQYNLNKDAQTEIRALTDKCSQNEKEYEMKLEEYANLLDMRAIKIQKLERQLNDVAYGTKKVKIDELQLELENIETLELSRGENVFEIHVNKFVFSSDGLEAVGSNNPSSFITWSFYEFEIQSTSVANGPKPQFNYAAQYKVKIDDFFLFYIHKNTMTLELHESIGSDYRTLAACQISFAELLEENHGRMHGNQRLISVIENTRGTVFGTVYFSIRLQVPMEEAFKLYKQKFKALKYIQSNHLSSNTDGEELKRPYTKNNTTNELHIKILRCHNLKGRHENVQPSAFCVYKFYDLPEQDTVIVPASNNPEFADHRTFTIQINSDLENYLKTQNLDVFVFDDNDPDISFYIGQTSICLLPLTQNKGVKGKFELKRGGKDSYGSIEARLYWNYPYQSCSHSIALPHYLETPIENPSVIAPVTPVLTYDEDDDEYDFTKESISPVPKPAKQTPTSHTAQPAVVSTSSSTTTNKASSVNSSSSSSPVSVKEENLQISTDAASKEVPRPAVRFSKLKQNVVNDAIDYGNIRKGDSDNEEDSPNLSLKSYIVKEVVDRSESSKNVKNETDTVKKEADNYSKEHSDLHKELSSDSESTSESNTDDKINPHDASEDYVVSRGSHIPAINIGISDLTLEPHSSIAKDAKVQMLYVEYRLLDFPIEEMETPYSLPKPTPPNSINFNYHKVFTFDPKENAEQYKMLSNMFRPDAPPEASWIKFNVVSEPPSDQEDLDCEDIGSAYIDLHKILSDKKDVLNEYITIYDAKDATTEIGKLKVTVEALKVLQMLS